MFCALRSRLEVCLVVVAELVENNATYHKGGRSPMLHFFPPQLYCEIVNLKRIAMVI